MNGFREEHDCNLYTRSGLEEQLPNCLQMVFDTAFMEIADTFAVGISTHRSRDPLYLLLSHRPMKLCLQSG